MNLLAFFVSNPTMSADINILMILPELIIGAAAVLVMMFDVFPATSRREFTAGTALVGISAAAVALLALWSNGSVAAPERSFFGMVVFDELRVGFSLIALLVSALTVLISLFWLDEEKLPAGEFFSLLLFATSGMLLMASGNDLVIIFLGIEILSIATYVMAGFRRSDLRSNEASLKYFILGSFSSAFLLFGIALTYGGSAVLGPDGAIHATTNITQIALQADKGLYPALLFAGAAMMLVGFGFKIASAPFHVWTPDVYEGAPSAVTAFMAAGPKAAGFASFMRVFVLGFPFVIAASNTQSFLHSTWMTALTVMAVVTMCVGNVSAIVQNNVKRMLAYSSIAHAGYALVGFVAAGAAADELRRYNAINSVVFYLLTYAIMNLGAFAIVTLIASKGDKRTDFEHYNGIGFKAPALAFTLAIFMLSLLGMPLTAGFMGKIAIFDAALSLEKPYIALVIIAVLNTAVSAYYYLRLIVVMFFKEGDAEWTAPSVPFGISVVLALTLVGVFLLGIFPGRILDAFQRAAPQASAIR